MPMVLTEQDLEGLRGLGDFFTAKEALSAKGDGTVMRAYLKKSLFER